jgi:hypothetical protein
MASPEEETGAGYGVGGVKETSMMAETDSERRILKLKLIFIYIYSKMKEEERITELGTGRGGGVFNRRQRNPRGIFV